MSLLSSQRHYAFDLDGTVFDTRHHVETAYASVGVMMPAGAWGRTWKEWLVPYCGGDMVRASMLHLKKGAVYTGLLETHPPELLPAGQLLKELIAERHTVSIMTGASVRAAAKLITMLGTPVCVLHSMSVHDKAKRLERLAASRPTVYVDDDLAALKMIEACGTQSRLVEFNGQGLDELREQVLDAWTQ